MSENEALLIFKQLIEAIKVLERSGIIHRDIKPENIFLHNDQVLLGDFGFCHRMPKGEKCKK